MSPPNDDLPEKRSQREMLLLPAQLQSAAQARTFIRTHALAAGFDADTVSEIEIAVGEATTNAVLYGAPPANAPPETTAHAVTVVFEELPDRIVIEIHDSGPGFEPGTVRRTDPGDSESLGGRGLILMEALMDTVALTRTPNGMVIRMERRRA